MTNLGPVAPLKIKLVVLDVDGVLCDGKIYGTDGKVVGKVFCDIDWTAIKMFKAAGVPVVFLSGDILNATIAVKRNIPFYHSRSSDGTLDKADVLDRIMKEYHVDVSTTAYVGDDIFDLEALEMVGWPYCPKNASPILQSIENITVLSRDSGQGVVAVLFKDLYVGGLVDMPSIESLKKIDRAES